MSRSAIQEQIKKEQKEHLMKLEECLQFILKDKRGRFFIADVLGELTMADASAYTGDNQTFKNLGQQQVYLGLKKRIEAVLGINGFNLWQKMEQERYERRLEQNERLKKVQV